MTLLVTSLEDSHKLIKNYTRLTTKIRQLGMSIIHNITKTINDLIKLYNGPPTRMAYIADLIERQTGFQLLDDIWCIIGDFLENSEETWWKYTYEDNECSFKKYYRQLIIECLDDARTIRYHIERRAILTSRNYHDDARHVSIIINKRSSRLEKKLEKVFI